MTHLKDLLPRSYAVFLGRFGRPTAIQERAVPAIRTGGDVLMTAPTAAGKTEAFAAPAAELVYGSERGRLTVLITSPTRALANDLFRRLEVRFEDANVAFGRYTGEHKDLAAGGKLPEVAIATPEALDSLLARRPRALGGVRLVVMDEIHILDNTVRGDHLRVLLHRLDLAAGRPVQRVAASATVDDPQGLARRYLRDATIVQVAGQRSILVRPFHGGSDVAICQHVDELAANGLRKILVFCNSRAAVERLTVALRARSRFRDAVFPHHGSLSQSVRERTEEHFLSAPAAVAVATMTLEIGIDIGSVDYVLLAGIPGSVSSLLQRIGRGNRRSGATRAGYVVGSDKDRLLAEAMFPAAKEGRLLGSPYGLRPSVFIQQTLAIAASHGWVDARRLGAAIPAALWGEAGADPAELIDRLIETGRLEASGGGRATASEKTEALYERGTLHSNLDNEPAVSVIDRISGDILGTVAPADSRRLQLAGRDRRIVKADGREILTDAAPGESPVVFSPRGRPLTSFALARDVVLRAVHELGDSADSGDIPWFVVGNDRIVLHGLGTLGSLVFASFLKNAIGRERLVDSSPFGVAVAGSGIALPSIPMEAIERFVSRNERKLEKLCAPGPWHGTLPKSVRVAALMRILDGEGLCRFLSAARLRFLDLPPRTAEEWASLVYRNS